MQFKGLFKQLLTPHLSQLRTILSILLMLLVLSTSSFSQGQFLDFKHRNVAFQGGLEYVNAMWFSPDNKFAYTASSGGMGIFDFDATTGTIRLKELQNMQVHGYGAMGIGNIVFTPDGQFAYATVQYAKIIYIFKRDAVTGRMTFLNEVPGVVDQYGYRTAMIVSPDSKFLYVSNGSILNIYKRNLTDGSVTHVKREWSGVGAADFYISQDGKFMYFGSAYMRVFTRDMNTGLLTLLEEHLNWGSYFGSSGYMAVTPDEKYIMLGTDNKGIGRIARDGVTGKLTYLGIFNYPQPENIYNPVGPTGVNGLRTNPEGNKLYVSGHKTLTSYTIDANGGLTLLDKVDVESTPNDPYFGLGISRNAEYIFAFGSGLVETSVQVFKENSNNELESVRINHFGESLNNGLYHITAEAISPDNQFVFIASRVDKCFAAFHSGVEVNGAMTEINRINYADLGLIDNEHQIRKILVSPDGKHLYVTTVKYASPNTSTLIILDVASTGEISYNSKIQFSNIVWDIQLSADGRFLYLACGDLTLKIFKRETTGELTTINSITAAQMGYNWGPEQIIITSTNKVLVKSMKAQGSSIYYWAFNANLETGELQVSIANTLVASAHYQDTYKMMLSETRNMIYFVTVYPSISFYTHSYNPETGALGTQSRILGNGEDGEWAGLSPDENLLFVNTKDDTRFYGFNDDGTPAYMGRESKAGGVAWSSGGGESGDERFFFPKNSKLIYASRQYGNGVFVYELKDVLPPMPPTNVTAAGGDRQIVIAWNKIKESGATYHVYRQSSDLGTTPGNNITKVGETTALSITDTSAPTYSHFYYWVKAVTATTSSVLSVNSNSARAYDLAPAAPASVALQSGDKFLKITWAANSENDLKNYTVYKNTTNSFASATLLTTTTALTVTDVSCDYGNTYYYWVKANDNGSNASVQSTVASGSPVDSPPAVPQGIAISEGDKYISLSWNSNTESDFASYQIYRGTTSGSANATLYKTVTGNVLTDTEVQYLQRYYYYFVAVDQRGNASAFTAGVSGMPVDNPPAKPLGIAVDFAPTEGVIVSWSSNLEPDLKGYKLFWNTSNVSANATQLVELTKLNNQYAYTTDFIGELFFWVKAIDTNNNESVFSESGSFVITGANTDEINSVTAYPNPVRDFLQINVDDPNATYVVVNALGVKAKSGSFNGGNIIDLRDLQLGNYIFKILSHNRVYVVRITKGN
jgi:6-phosphogluconolactonase (cycloisomerase 2 family)/fibronectin type 3 domain-containing protein